MKKKIIIIFIFIGLSLTAQNKFKKGYFILDNNSKIECYIEDKGFVDTPQNFTYKTTLKGKNQKGTITEIKEFSVIDKFKYKRFKVLIDKSSSNNNRLSNTRKSRFIEETLFLNTLLENSEFSLYEYRNQTFTRYFYEKNEILKQLEYKLFLTKNNYVSKNINYLKQLKDNFPCKNLKTKNISYTKKDLIKYFINYNKCKNNISLINYDVKFSGKSKFNFYLRAGVNSNKYNLFLPGNIATTERNVNFNSKTSISFGAELEYVMPFNNNAWSVFIDPSYISYDSTTEQKDPIFSTRSRIYIAKYNSIELPLGIRKYFFLNNKKKHKMLVNLGVAFDIPFNSFFSYEEKSPNFLKTSKTKFQPTPNFFFGAGYILNEKIKIELRYNTSKNLNQSGFDSEVQYADWKESLNNTSFLISYNLF